MSRIPSDQVPDELKAVAVELRLAGVMRDVVDYYLHCGDESVKTLMKWVEHDGLEHINGQHRDYLIREKEL
jgi:hypothetical protein